MLSAILNLCLAAPAVFICLPTCFINAAKVDIHYLEERVDKYIQAGLACHNNPGVSVSVVRDDEVLIAKGYGYRTLEELEPVTNKTLFGIASLTKAFAATLVLKLIEENKNVSLSTTVCKLLGNEDCFHGYLRSKYSTLEDLMAHRMGIPSNNQIRLDDTLTRKTITERIRFMKPLGGFRTSFYYSNLMYGILTRIAEVIGGSTWEELVQSKLFDPLDMTSSSFLTTADFQKLDIALGYQDRDGFLLPVPNEFSRRWGDLCGSGCILSNSMDMANWLMFNLNGGRNRKKEKVIASASLAHAHKAHNSVLSSSTAKYYRRPLTPVSFTDDNYGLGWKLGYYRGFPIVTHTGSTYGYRARITMFPGLDIGIFTAMTGSDPSFHFRTNIHLYIADLLTGHDPWLNNDTVCSFPEPWRTKPKAKPSAVLKDISPTRSLTEYEGVYTKSGYGRIMIYQNTTTKYLMARYGYGQIILYPKTVADQFYGEGFGLLKNIRDYSSFKFLSEKGDVGEVTVISSLSIPSFETKMPPVFKRIRKKEVFAQVHGISENTGVQEKESLSLIIFSCLAFAIISCSRHKYI